MREQIIVHFVLKMIEIRCENIAIREALRNVICPSCGGVPLREDSYYDKHKLRIENSQLKQEVKMLLVFKS